jgi:predicted transglutaminase-like cysteine proteinase
MLRTGHSRVISRAFGLLLAASFSIVAIHAATAKPRAGKTAANEVTGMDAPAPLRFFTINGILAKHDGGTLPSATRIAATDDGPIVTDAPSPGMVPLTSDEPFGLFAFRAPEGVLWTKWRAVRETMRAEAGQLERCRSSEQECSAAAEHFLGIVASAHSTSGRARIERVNLMVNNAVRYVSDFVQHGVADRWSAPLVTLAAGQGDCEDYAILKYAALREAGVAEADLRLLLVKDRAVRQDHAVLAVRLDARWLVLDNRRAAPLETADLGHFLPLFALDGRGVNVFAAPYASRAMHESETDMLPASDIEATGGGLRELPLLL